VKTPIDSEIDCVWEGSGFRSCTVFQSDGFFRQQAGVEASHKQPDAVARWYKYKDISWSDGNAGRLIQRIGPYILGGSLLEYQYGGNINSRNTRGFDFGLTFQGVGKPRFHNHIQKFHPAFSRKLVGLLQPYIANDLLDAYNGQRKQRIKMHDIQDYSENASGNKLLLFRTMVGWWCGIFESKTWRRIYVAFVIFFGAQRFFEIRLMSPGMIFFYSIKPDWRNWSRQNTGYLITNHLYSGIKA